MAGYLLRFDQEDVGNHFVSVVYCELHANCKDSALLKFYQHESCQQVVADFAITDKSQIKDAVGFLSSCFNVAGHQFCARSPEEKEVWIRVLMNLKVKILNAAPEPQETDLNWWREAILERILDMETAPSYIETVARQHSAPGLRWHPASSVGPSGHAFKPRGDHSAREPSGFDSDDLEQRQLTLDDVGRADDDDLPLEQPLPSISALSPRESPEDFLESLRAIPAARAPAGRVESRGPSGLGSSNHADEQAAPAPWVPPTSWPRLSERSWSRDEFRNLHIRASSKHSTVTDPGSRPVDDAGSDDELVPGDEMLCHIPPHSLPNSKRHPGTLQYVPAAQEDSKPTCALDDDSKTTSASDAE
eukprot:gnl/TRDRNA2_/TRDRNA2_87492_c1_seq1.p1 gnl/TRDRNA2_/TRDRNA2_87492_c1~~gnl/TRDRNA2_/TRDRNA2_87492_c1_seq1.p1  ORF type:complete len:424 (-),score=65.10 gnl/TRDRNA2_/TRDRNA2_87492_c1_seq1:44-1126(-)